MFGVISAQAHLLPLALVLTMATIGIELRVSYFVALLAKPKTAIIGTLIHTFTFPVIATCLVFTIISFQLPLSEPLLIGILLIAACPSGGFSNVLVLIAKADIALSVLLTSISSIFSFVTVPLFFWAFGQFTPQLSGTVEIPVLDTFLRLFLLIVFPVGAGMA
jgi:BASS family bile acid:Na+ symporter